MNAMQVMDRYWKEVIQVSTQKHDINVQYLYDIVFLFLTTTMSRIILSIFRVWCVDVRQWGTPLKKAKISHEVENVFFCFFQLYLYIHSNEKGSNKNERNEESETIKIRQDWSRVAIRTVQGAWFCWKCMNVTPLPVFPIILHFDKCSKSTHRRIVHLKSWKYNISKIQWSLS